MGVRGWAAAGTGAAAGAVLGWAGRRGEPLVDLDPVWVGSGARAAIQRRYEAPTLRRLGGGLDGGAALEIGCGRGVGARLAVEAFGAGTVVAVDVHPDTVQRAAAAVDGLPAGVVSFSVGDATRLDLPDASVDGVFDYHTLHHVGRWRVAVAEVARVLRPGGRLYFSELTRRATNSLPLVVLTAHPRQDRFDTAELVAELGRHGLDVGGRLVEHAGGAWVLGAAVRRRG